jgi:hypothetical protein
MAHRMGIEDAQDPELGELAKDVHPEKVLDAIEQHRKTIDSSSPDKD